MGFPEANQVDLKFPGVYDLPASASGTLGRKAGSVFKFKLLPLQTLGSPKITNDLTRLDGPRRTV